MEYDIKISGVNFHYRAEGRGRAVVLMHGWGCDRTVFAQLYGALTPFFRVYAVDFPGFGLSGAPAEVWGIEEYTACFEEFVRTAGIENPVLVGHSFGGRVAILFASRNPVHKVILVDAAGIRPRRTLKYYLKIYSYKLYKRLLPLAVGRGRAERMLDRYRRKVGSSDYNALNGTMRRILVKVVNEDLRSFLPRIGAPTLLIWGDLDTATPIGDARIMERAIPDAGLVVFPGASHFSFLERPGQFLAVVDNFLNEDKTSNHE